MPGLPISRLARTAARVLFFTLILSYVFGPPRTQAGTDHGSTNGPCSEGEVSAVPLLLVPIDGEMKQVQMTFQEGRREGSQLLRLKIDQVHVVDERPGSRSGCPHSKAYKFSEKAVSTTSDSVSTDAAGRAMRNGSARLCGKRNLRGWSYRQD